MTDVYAVTVECPTFPGYYMAVRAFDDHDSAVDFIEKRMRFAREESVMPEQWTSRHGHTVRVRWIPGDDGDDA